MTEQVGKLVDLFTKGVEKIGGEASCLYPEVIKLYMWEHILSVVFTLSVVVVFITAFILDHLSKLTK